MSFRYKRLRAEGEQTVMHILKDYVRVYGLRALQYAFIKSKAALNHITGDYKVLRILYVAYARSHTKIKEIPRDPDRIDSNIRHKEDDKASSENDFSISENNNIHRGIVLVLSSF